MSYNKTVSKNETKKTKTKEKKHTAIYLEQKCHNTKKKQEEDFNYCYIKYALGYE